MLTKCDGQYRDIKYREDIMTQIANLTKDLPAAEKSGSWHYARHKGSRMNPAMMSGTLDIDTFLSQMDPKTNVASFGK